MWAPLCETLCFSYLAVIKMQEADIDQTVVAKLCLTSHKTGEQLDSN